MIWLITRQSDGCALAWKWLAPPLALPSTSPGNQPVIARMATSLSCFSGRRCPGTTPLFRSLDICIHKVTRESICFGILWSVSNQQVDDTFGRSFQKIIFKPKNALLTNWMKFLRYFTVNILCPPPLPHFSNFPQNFELCVFWCSFP